MTVLSTKNAPDAWQGVEGSDHSPNLQEGTTVMPIMTHTPDSAHAGTLLTTPAAMPSLADALLLSTDEWGTEHDEPVPYSPVDPAPPARRPAASINARWDR